MTSADDPEYTTHAVAERTGIPAETFLAWERRHGIPMPYRTANQERLYSRRDIDDILWLRKRTYEGIPIRHAIAQLKARASEDRSDSPSATATATATDVVVSMTPTPDITTRPAHTPKRAGEQTIVASMVNALTSFDDRQAADILAEYAALGTTSFLTATIVPDVLAQLSARVSAGESSPAAERLGHLFLARKLGALLDAINSLTSGPPTLVAGVSTETQEIDVLIEAIRIARTGQHVLFLGTDISLIDLVTVTSATDPQQIALVASTANAARTIGMYHEHLRLHFPGETQPRLLAIGPAYPSMVGRPAGDVSQRSSALGGKDHLAGESGNSLTDQ